MVLQVAEQQERLLGRRCDVSLPAKYRDYLMVKRNYDLHRPEDAVSAAEVNYSRLPQCLYVSVYKNIVENFCDHFSDSVTQLHPCPKTEHFRPRMVNFDL